MGKHGGQSGNVQGGFTEVPAIESGGVTPQLDGQPRARRPKLAFDSGQRDIQRLRCFLERQSAEVPLLQDPAASLIHGCEAEGAEPEPGSVPSVASLHRDDNDPLSHLLLGQPHRATGLEPTTHIV